MSTQPHFVARSCSNLVELVRLQASQHAEKQAYVFLADGEKEEGSLSYGELDLRARAVAARLQSLEAHGERVLLACRPGLEYITAFYGSLLAGAVAVPVYPPRLRRADPRFFGILKDSGARVAIATADVLSGVQKAMADTQELRSLEWVSTDSIPVELAEKWQKPELGSDSLALLQYTSGSTAFPRGVMVTHGNLLHNLSLIQECFELTPKSRCVSWLPPYHDMGLIGVILSGVWVPFTCILMSPFAFVQKPFRWLQAITRYRGTISVAPNFAYDLCSHKITEEQKASLELSSWHAALNGSESIRDETLREFYQRFKQCGFRLEAFFPCYGLAEGTLVVSGKRSSSLPVTIQVSKTLLEQNLVREVDPQAERVQTLVGCGQVAPGVSVAIVDSELQTPCHPDRVGEIWVRSKSVALGYWNRTEETKNTFQAFLAHSCETSFLRTGDLGFVKNNELFITGRIKDLIIIRGNNHYPQDIEVSVERSHPQIRPGSAAAFAVQTDGRESLLIAVEIQPIPAGMRVAREESPGLPPELGEIVRAIVESVSENHELQVFGVLLLKPGTIPRTSSGKIRRNACRTAFLQGTLEGVGRWLHKSVETAVIGPMPEAKGLHRQES